MIDLAGIAPFADLDALQIGALVALYTAAFLVKGVFGYGALPLLIVGGSLIVPPHHAVLLAAIANLLTHVQLMPEGWREGQRRQVAWLAVFMLPTIVAGVWVFSRLDGGNLNLVTGVVILATVLVDWLRLLDPLAEKVRANVRFAGPVVGTVSGLVSGIIGAGTVSIISLYVRMLAPGWREFRATIVLITGVILVWRTFVLTVSGFIDLTLVVEALLLLPGALLSGYVSRSFSNRLNDGLFFAGYRLVLLVGATLLIVRGLLFA